MQMTKRMHILQTEDAITWIRTINGNAYRFVAGRFNGIETLTVYKITPNRLDRRRHSFVRRNNASQ